MLGMDEAIQRIIKNLPREFFQQVAEETDAAFALAHLIAREKIDPQERRWALPQLRHFLSEKALRQAAQNTGLVAHVPDTVPKGSCYSVVEHTGIFIIRSNVQAHCNPPRPARFRQRWATLNKWMSPHQDDLFEFDEPHRKISTERMCAMLVVTANKSGDQSIPAFVGLGIPSACLSTWLFLESVSTILALFHDAEADMKQPTEAPVEVKDRAVPKLKRRGESNGQE